MKITLICVGKVKEAYYRELIAQYTKEIRKKYEFEVIELQDEKTPDKASQKEEEKIKEVEGERIINRIPDRSIVIPLCIEGKQYTLEELKTQCMNWKESNQNIVFIIGGSLGLAKQVVKKGKILLSFSRMTFPHQLMRVILLEQISRF